VASSPHSLLIQNSTTHLCGEAMNVPVRRNPSDSNAACESAYSDGLLQGCEATSLKEIFSGI
jgi:hypothetical protein